MQETNVRIYPYVRGYAPRHALAALWSLVEEDGAGEQIFAREESDTPFSLTCDLPSFVAYFSTTEGENARFTLVCEDVITGEVMGLVWFDRIQPGWSGFANVWMRKKFRGKRAIEAGQAAIHYAFQQFGWSKIWALTHHKHSARFSQFVGFKPLIKLEDFSIGENGPVDSYMLSMTKEQFYAKEALKHGRESTENQSRTTGETTSTAA